MSEFEAYRGLFVAESRENHENMVKGLLVLEQGVDDNAIDEIFRAVHTLKGASASMGFDEPEHLCHSMEDIFQNIRNGSLQISSDLTDLLLSAADVIENMIDDIEGGGDGANAEAAPLITSLKRWASLKPSSSQGAASAPATILEAGSSGEPEDSPEILEGVPVYSVQVTLKEECLMKDIRALLVIQSLEAFGTIIETTPSRAAIDDGDCGVDLMVVVQSDAGSDSLKVAAEGPDVQSVQVVEQEIPLAVPASSDTSDSTVKKGREEEEPKTHEKNREIKNLRVDIQQLDHMMNLVEDLVINRGRMKQIAEQYKIKEMDEAISVVERSVSELQNLMMNIRMIPLQQIFNRFPRVVRDVAKYDGKEVEFLMEGGETELDRSVMDGLSDPLLHLIRNAINHGLESPETRERLGKERVGTVRLSARRDRDNVIIELTDDGAGIDVERVRSKAVQKGLMTRDAADALTEDEVINILFQPGFSTAEKITDISGRGVGLDVVKSAIESLKGSVNVKTVLGKMTRFELVLPPTMAIVQVMIVRINGRRCAIPINSIVEVATLDMKSVHQIGSGEAILLRDEVLPIYWLDEMFGKPGNSDIVLVIQYLEKKCGIPLDTVEGQQEVVVKPLSRLIGSSRGVSGITILGDGDVVPVLDVNTMV
uniref:chemotaxis protein CheA n=1 Tax=Methanosphaerula palustris TaxID=475088 RepID=UPI000321E3C1|nr:chemotaxis protein CheA [Methanosphaerula palustris]